MTFRVSALQGYLPTWVQDQFRAFETYMETELLPQRYINLTVAAGTYTVLRPRETRGMLVIVSEGGDGLAIYNTKTTSTRVIDGNALSATKDTALSTNVYFEGGELRMQNTTAGAIGYAVKLL